MKIAELNRRIERMRHDAKRIHGYTDAELAKLIGCSASTLTHRASDGTLYRLPAYQVERLKELSEEE